MANGLVRRWVDEVANVQVHATTKAVLATRLTEEQAVMLPPPALKAQPALPVRIVIPVESLRHPAGRVRRAAGGSGVNLQHRRTAESCEQLAMACLATEWPALAQQAARDESSFADCMEKLLQCRSAAREPRKRTTLMELAPMTREGALLWHHSVGSSESR